ncbi:MAG: protein kinase [Myxococcales bacterium]|nr:protein kinase [Myxococcales bacterium]
MPACSRCHAEVAEAAKFCDQCGSPLDEHSDAAALTAVGQVLDNKYRLRYLIGMGGMGAVFRAEVLGLGHSVAVKVLHPTLSADDECRRRLENEARLASSIDHPNIVSILDFSSSADLSYLVMEYLRGRSLADVLGTEGRIEVRRAIHIVRQILSALEAAHARDVLHRDLKPENIFLLFRGNELDDVKILDFGMATIPGPASSRITGGDKVVGTPAYMSPEQARGLDLDHRSDLYSAAIVLYECLTGNNPFAGGTATDALLKQLTVSPPMPSKVCKEARIPPYLDALVMRALRKDPVDRFASAAEFRRVLEGLVLARHVPADGDKKSDKTREQRSISTCPECGRALSLGDTRCGGCGTALGKPVLGREALSELLSPELITALEETEDGSSPEVELSLSPTSTVTANPAIGWDPPLVGLQREIERLEALVQSQAGGVIRIVGRAGAGKGRLAREGTRRGEQIGLATYWVSPELRPATASLRPIQRLTLRLLRIHDAPLERDELLKRARENAGLDMRHAEGLLEIFSSSRSKDAAPTRRARRDAAFVEVVRCAARRTPLLLAFHDVQEMDTPSRELVMALVRALSGSDGMGMPGRVVVLVTHSPDMPQLWPESERINVEPLSASGASELAGQLLASIGLEADPDAIASASSGSPLMIIELTRLLNLDPFARLPRSLAEVINRRISQLPPRARIVLHAMAVVGRATSPDTISSVISETQADPGTLTLLAEQGFLRVSDRGWMPSHQVHQQVAYASTPRAVRVSLHREAARMSIKDGESPGQVAYHLMEAGDREQAVPYLLRGGWDALRQLDHGQATQHFQHVLEVVPSPPKRFGGSGKAWASAVAGLASSLVDAGDPHAAFEIVRGAVRSASEAKWQDEAAKLQQHYTRLEALAR